jgi:hypothetical protein
MSGLLDLPKDWIKSQESYYYPTQGNTGTVKLVYCDRMNPSESSYSSKHSVGVTENVLDVNNKYIA